MNPADAATRGLTVEKLKVTTNWLEGPEFLTTERGLWPEQPPEPGWNLADILPETITGLKKPRHGNIEELLLTSSSQFCLFSAAPARDNYYEPREPLLLKFSNWSKLVRIVAYCRRLMTRKTVQMSPLEKIEAERSIVYHSQQAAYRAMLFQLKTHIRVNHDNALAPLAPFLDAQGLVRLSGRTEATALIYEAKYPLLLHAKDPLTEVLLRLIHRELMHQERYKQNYPNYIGCRG
jgi:hypothetical protein